MRRNYISPEFTYNTTNGTMNMMEETSFFGSKMLYTPANISILNQNIIYHQSSNGDQLNAELEQNSDPIIYNSSKDKKNNHTIIIDPSQSNSQKNNNTKWIIQIDLKTILNNYVYAILKQNRTFNGVNSSMTSYNNTNSAIIEYINNNILGRYEFTSIIFYIQYQSFLQTGTLRFTNSFLYINNSTYLINQLQSTLDPSGNNITINFTQQQNSSSYNFNYYFDLFFEKI